MEEDLDVSHVEHTSGEEHAAGLSEFPEISKTSEEGDYCRICRGEGTSELPLFYPCKCSGSIKFVHQDCLMEWLSHSRKKYCELCKTPFRFTKLYDHSMPQTLPLAMFLRKLGLNVLKNCLHWVRYLLVGIVWLAWLPWSIRQIWRGLFWLADGSWGLTQKMETNGTSQAGFSRPSITLSLSFKTETPPPEVSSSAGWFGYPSNDLLLVKVVRFLSPGLYDWATGLAAVKISSNTTTSLGRLDRPPSMLSDFRYLENVTPYKAINNIFLDVLEGQLISVCVVTTFVLIFLIREWVINQHPAVEAQGENAEPIPVAGAEEGGFGGPARRPRRRAEAVDERPRAVAPPRQRRRSSQSNVERDVVPTTPEIPAAEETSSEEAGDSTPAGSQDADMIDTEDSSPTARPALPERNAMEDAASIHRSIEEARPPASWPGLETFKQLWTTANKDPKEVLRIIREEKREEELGWVVMQMEKLQKQKNRSPQETLLDSSSTESENDGDPRPLFTTDFESRFTQRPFRNFRSLQTPENSGTITPEPRKMKSDDVTVSESEDSTMESSSRISASSQIPHYSRSVTPEPRETESENAAVSDSGDQALESQPDLAQPSSASTPRSASGSAIPNTPHSDESETHGTTPPSLPVQSCSILDMIADWLWDIDLETAFETPPTQVGIENPEILHLPLPDLDTSDDEEEPEEQNPEVVAAAAAAGIDVNDPEIMDDVEDLEGILDLIGIQGPITGMVQNVIFSEILITFTLLASVWLPYIWGKITLLLLYNPVTFFVRAPLLLATIIANTFVDVSLFFVGITLYTVTHALASFVNVGQFISPALQNRLAPISFEKLSFNLATGSGARLEKSIYGVFTGLKPDLPTFSALSHEALLDLRQQLALDFESVGHFLVHIFRDDPLSIRQCFQSYKLGQFVSGTKCLSQMAYRQTATNVGTLLQGLRNLRSLNVDSEPPEHTVDYSLLEWGTRDRVWAIIIGYCFFALMGYLYMKAVRLFAGARAGAKVEGIVAESLGQAGGVVKVILIIGIEMILFPLYCGLLLDIALMPLFEGAGFHSRLAFVFKAPLTALFVHWFVGTCYMFHFALFVSMCRKIMRKGVLYFIRDPDDPTFHPVRDVLERSVTTQLSKIAFSGLVYGGLVILCLGGIVWMVSLVKGIFPIQWTSSEPILDFPIDLLFYNFLLPILIRRVEPSKKLNAMYAWWFRKCASWLRLTNFLFGDHRLEEQGRHVRHSWAAVLRQTQGDVAHPVIGEERRLLADDRQVDVYFLRDGTFVRAPGSDSVRIPKGTAAFLHVDEDNNRLDGNKDHDEGVHGKTNDKFIKVYIPPMFRTRISTFVLLIWAFAALTGVLFTILPLVLGRMTIQLITQRQTPPNDLYSFSVGLYVFGLIAYGLTYGMSCKQWAMSKMRQYAKDSRQLLPRVWTSTTYALGIVYLGVMFGVVLPFVFSAISELYIITPLQTYLDSSQDPQQSGFVLEKPPSFHLVQMWTLGLIFLRIGIRLATEYPTTETRAAVAMRAILRRGNWYPDVRLTTRAFILPSLVVTFILLSVPFGIGYVANKAWHEPVLAAKIYRYAYPGILGVAMACYCIILLKRQVGFWRARIRDDVYLIGERLHNFGESQRKQALAKGKARARDGNVSERLQMR